MGCVNRRTATFASTAYSLRMLPQPPVAPCRLRRHCGRNFAPGSLRSFGSAAAISHRLRLHHSTADDDPSRQQAHIGCAVSSVLQVELGGSVLASQNAMAGMFGLSKSAVHDLQVAGMVKLVVSKRGTAVELVAH